MIARFQISLFAFQWYLYYVFIITWHLYVFNWILDSVLLYVYSSHTRVYKIVLDATINTLQPTPWSIVILQEKKQCCHYLFTDQHFLQLIIVLQYHAEGNCAGTGAHVVHSNCAHTRLVNIATYSELYNAVHATNAKTIPSKYVTECRVSPLVLDLIIF